MFRRTCLLLSLAAALCLSTSCSDDSPSDEESADTGAADTAGDDTRRARDTHDPNCHTDCFGGYTCADGEVHALFYGPVPCSYGDSCPPPELLGTCEFGCARSSADHSEFEVDSGQGWQSTMCRSASDVGDTNDCHIDCFGGYVCEAGTVYEYAYGPMPCSEGDTCSRTEVGQCTGGCAQSSWSGSGSVDAGESEWRANLCAETADAGDTGG